MKLHRVFFSAVVLGVLALAGCGPQNQPPVAKINFLPTTPKVNENIDFFGGSSQDPDNDKIVSYKWEFGDGATAEGESVSHAYAAAGSYTVKLAVTDEKGASGEATETVVVLSSALVTCTLPEDTNYSDLTWGGQALWAIKEFIEGEEDVSMIYKLSTSCQVQAKLKFPGEAIPSALAWDGQNLWVAAQDYDEQDDFVQKLYQINPANGDLLGSCQLRNLEDEVRGMTWDGSYLWTAVPEVTGSNTIVTRLEKITPSGTNCQVRSSVKVQAEAESLTWDGQSLWVADLEQFKLLKVNPATGAIEASVPAPDDSIPSGLAWDNGIFWILDTSGTNATLIRFPLP